MRINNNISAMNTYSRLTSAQGAQSKSLEKLSSGLRINRAGDDAAGLAISEKMRGQIKGLNQSVRNAQDGISLIQTAEGALNETHSILNRMRELAVQSSNDTNTDEDRVEIQKEMNQLSSEVNRISNDTEFNTQKLLNGDFSDKKFHIGANEGQSMSINVSNMSSTSLGVESQVTEAADVLGANQGILVRSNDTEEAISITFVKADGNSLPTTATKSGNTITVSLGTNADNTAVATTKGAVKDALSTIEGLVIETDTNYGADDAVTAVPTLATVPLSSTVDANGFNVSSQETADAAITIIDEAIKSVSAERSKLGAVQNRLDHTINNLTATSENLSAAESRIRDVDMAKEMMEFTKNNILNQASTAMLAQANQMPQGVLQLLG